MDGATFKWFVDNRIRGAVLVEQWKLVDSSNGEHWFCIYVVHRDWVDQRNVVRVPSGRNQLERNWFVHVEF